jgi:glycosyltransferase involved in cell wall biosynthesis
VTAQKPDCTGSGIYLSQMVSALDRAGHEQAVICGIAGTEEFEVAPGVQMFPVRFETEQLPFSVCGMSDVMPYKATRYRDLTPEMGSQFEDAFSGVVDKAYQEFGPDLVICNHLYFLTAIVRERIEDVPVVGICHATCLRQLATNPFQVERIMREIPRLDRIFALHEVQKQAIVDRFGVDGELVDVIGTGYDAEVFSRNDAIVRCDNPKRIVYAGKISNAKGVASLMRALRYLEVEPGSVEIRCVGGAGDVLEYEQIRRLSDLSPHPVLFLGRIPKEDLVEEYQRADTFVLPSFHEGLPLVTIETLACGCKVVCCDWPGVRSWMEGHLKNAPIRYVALPEGVLSDKACGSEQPAFERRLARALEDSLGAERVVCDMSDLTWDSLVRRLMGFLGFSL